MDYYHDGSLQMSTGEARRIMVRLYHLFSVGRSEKGALAHPESNIKEAQVSLYSFQLFCTFLIDSYPPTKPILSIIFCCK